MEKYDDSTKAGFSGIRGGSFNERRNQAEERKKEERRKNDPTHVDTNQPAEKKDAPASFLTMGLRVDVSRPALFF